ncbi:MAG: hypothetical protein ABW217_18910 [Polyangiaceae bacterium]
MPEASDHAQRVDAWLGATTPGASPDELRDLLERALNALWRRTKVTLGEVTLIAIVDRVLYNAGEKYPFFSSISVEPSFGFRCEGLRERTDVQGSALIAGSRFVLVELLTVLGNLTADILTPELHDELARVHRADPGGTSAATGDAAVIEPESAES